MLIRSVYKKYLKTGSGVRYTSGKYSKTTSILQDLRRS